MRLKRLVEFLKGIYRTYSQAIIHLMATGPKLDGNTLHIKASFVEWTVILWLK